MKHLTVLAALIIVLALIPAGQTITKPGVIRVTANTISIRSLGDRERLRVLSIYNRALTSRSIGNGQMICWNIDGGGPLPEDAQYCLGTFSIGNNSLQVHGVARNPYNYQLGITGGTGTYNNVGGTFTSIRYSSRPIRERLIFQLTYP